LAALRRIARPPTAASKLDAPSGTYRRIYAVVAKIPRGRVATYGQVAERAGMGGQARLVGYALHALPEESSVPWHRVVNARGRVSERSDGSPMNVLQRKILESESVRFDERGSISLERYRWNPREPRFPESRPRAG
jgi:methylated-DNA-protein-cysteine methyltransferase-like protein